MILEYASKPGEDAWCVMLSTMMYSVCSPQIMWHQSRGYQLESLHAPLWHGQNSDTKVPLLKNHVC